MCINLKVTWSSSNGFIAIFNHLFRKQKFNLLSVTSLSLVSSHGFLTNRWHRHLKPPSLYTLCMITDLKKWVHQTTNLFTSMKKFIIFHAYSHNPPYALNKHCLLHLETKRLCFHSIKNACWAKVDAANLKYGLTNE